MEIKGFPPMPVVKLTDEQIAAAKAAAEKFKEKVASGEIVIKPLDGPSPVQPGKPGVIYHPDPVQPGGTPMVAINTPLTYDSKGTVVLKPQG